MLVVVSDTHSREESKLQGRTAEAVRGRPTSSFTRVTSTASRFSTRSSRPTRSLRAVYGNNDDAGIRDRVPEVRTVEYAGVRFAVTHRHRNGDTGLVMLARERDADAVICGHSHRPRFDDDGALPILNPGSHAQPRGNRPAHAELEPASEGESTLNGRLVTPDGQIFGEFQIAP